MLVPKTKPYVSFIAYRNAETVISWNTKASDRDINGNETGTFNTATVDIQSDYFCATGITFEVISFINELYSRYFWIADCLIRLWCICRTQWFQFQEGKECKPLR